MTQLKQEGNCTTSLIQKFPTSFLVIYNSKNQPITRIVYQLTLFNRVENRFWKNAETWGKSGRAKPNLRKIWPGKKRIWARQNQSQTQPNLRKVDRIFRSELNLLVNLAWATSIYLYYQFLIWARDLSRNQRVEACCVIKHGLLFQQALNINCSPLDIFIASFRILFFFEVHYQVG